MRPAGGHEETWRAWGRGCMGTEKGHAGAVGNLGATKSKWLQVGTNVEEMESRMALGSGGADGGVGMGPVLRWGALQREPIRCEVF